MKDNETESLQEKIVALRKKEHKNTISDEERELLKDYEKKRDNQMEEADLISECALESAKSGNFKEARRSLGELLNSDYYKSTRIRDDFSRDDFENYSDYSKRAERANFFIGNMLDAECAVNFKKYIEDIFKAGSYKNLKDNKRDDVENMPQGLAGTIQDRHMSPNEITNRVSAASRTLKDFKETYGDDLNYDPGELSHKLVCAIYDNLKNHAIDEKDAATYLQTHVEAIKLIAETLGIFKTWIKQNED
ncbi:MAG: hypothetical protein Q8O89_07100 [Nanoarchaeota archaeon]|nr:hypothetical protein [Nanoarchaeota archaeon]